MLTIKISMMKNFKLYLLSFVLIIGFLTSCSNNESVVEEQNIDETEAITTTLSRLAGQFDGQGNIVAASNPSGNIVFDFGFDFVYPLNLSFNNGTVVAVNNLEELISIIINSTENLYISGIEFPFDVEVYNEETDSIEVITINSEDEFFDLINNLDWDTQDSCVCTEDYSPVCVQVSDPNGESFVIAYPNECYALCDGFTANDFVENCADDYNNAGGFDCFELNFPITIFTDENQTITVNSQSELDNALYNAYYFDFVYPFEVINQAGEIITINSGEEIIALLEDCYDIVTGPGDCDCPNDAIDPVCVQIENPNGLLELFVFPNACIAECEGFSSENFVDCENVNNPDCQDQDYIENLVNCAHFVYPLNNGNGGPDESFIFVFNANGTINIQSIDGNYTTTGTWELGDTNVNGDQSLIITEALGDLNDVWGITGCDAQFVYMYSAAQNYVIDVQCN
jgi:hypothetical protein